MSKFRDQQVQKYIITSPILSMSRSIVWRCREKNMLLGTPVRLNIFPSKCQKFIDLFFFIRGSVAGMTVFGYFLLPERPRTSTKWIKCWKRDTWVETDPVKCQKERGRRGVDGARLIHQTKQDCWRLGPKGSTRNLIRPN